MKRTLSAGSSEKVKQSQCGSERQQVARKVVIGVMLLIVLCGGLQQGQAAEPEAPVSIKDIKPKVTQPDGIVTLTFNKKVTPSSVRIGTAEASIVSPTADVTTLKVRVAPNTLLGTQGIAVTLTGESSPLTDLIIVAPEVAGLKANKDAQIQLSRVAVAGGEIIVQFNGSIPSEIRQKLSVTVGTRELRFTIPQNDYLIVEVPNDLDQATYIVQVSVDGTPWNGGTPLEKKPRLRVEYASSMYVRASLVLIALIVVIYLLYRLFHKLRVGQTRNSFVTMLLLEEENQTYSLSRAQFIGWLTVIVWSYLFLYYARGRVEDIWAFPNLGNAVYAFFISLGTLVAAQATSIGQGAKGAGEVHPSPADLVVHGGVLALDRVQQVIWTLIALWLFFRITISTYATATALPEIPPELLGLMGLSSVGYLGGKLVRGAGPIIEQVTPRAGSLILNIKGRHLSKEAFVWLDGVKQQKDNVKVLADDLDSPLQFAKEIEVTLAMSIDDWNAKDHAVTIINEDAQRADWHTEPTIIDVTAGTPTDGKVLLTIKGAHLAVGATVEITGASDAKPVQDKNDPNTFTVEVAEAWSKEPHELIVTSNGQKGSYTYKPKV